MHSEVAYHSLMAAGTAPVSRVVASGGTGTSGVWIGLAHAKERKVVIPLTKIWLQGDANTDSDPSHTSMIPRQANTDSDPSHKGSEASQHRL